MGDSQEVRSKQPSSHDNTLISPKEMTDSEACSQVELPESIVGAKPPLFSWVEDGLLATSATPTHHDQYNWLINSRFSTVISLEPARPKQILQHKKKLNNILVRVQKYSVVSIPDIRDALEVMDEQHRKGFAVLVHCPDGRQSSAVFAACYLLREYHMQFLQNGHGIKNEMGQGGFSNLWFPERPYDFSHDAPYKPYVEDVNNMLELKFHS